MKHPTCPVCEENLFTLASSHVCLGPRQRELDEIYVSSQGLIFYPKGYVEWRLEFERAGKQYAYERMMESYEGAKSDNSWADHQGTLVASSSYQKRGQDAFLSLAKPKQRRSLYRWWDDLPENLAMPLFLFSVYFVLAAVVVVILALCGCFNLYSCNSTKRRKT
jgi:hypothetical protein